MISEDKVKGALNEMKGKAEAMLNDEEGTKSFLNDIEGKLDQFKLEGIMDDVKMVIKLLKDVVNKKYTDIPYTSIAALLGALLYLVKSRDLIPDSIPVAGQLDDLAIMVLALKLSKGDIEKYKKWLADQTA